MKADEIVLIHDPVKPRYARNLGRITEVLPGKDKKTRCAKVKRSDGQEAIYPVCNLFPMELRASDETTTTADSNAGPADEQPPSRPRRAAAISCLEWLKQCNKLH